MATQRITLILAAVVSFSWAQSYGVGWGKTTFSTSDASGCYDWMQAQLPIVQDHPNGPRACGAVGRARLDTGSGGGWSSGFGIHSVQVNASSSRVHPECMRVETVETALDQKLHRVYEEAQYDTFMDFNSGHWVSNLDPYVHGFQNSSVPFATLRWEDSVNNKSYFSVIVRVHTSQLFIELLSGNCTTCNTHLQIQSPPRYVFAKDQGPTDVFGALDDTTSTKPLMHPAKISWPSSNAARERKFLADGLGAKIYATHQAGDVLTDVYDFTPLMAAVKGMQLHVVQRPSNDTTGALSWADFESALQTCHKATIKDDLCGENTWMDHHMGFGIHGNNTVATDAQKLKQLSTKLGLPFHVTPSNGGGVAVYAIAGNGLSITFQVPQGTYQPPRPLNTTAGMLNLCDNGSCPTCSNLCDDTGECGNPAGAKCADLVKIYPCKDYYAPGKPYAGWCDKTCDYGVCPKKL